MGNDRATLKDDSGQWQLEVVGSGDGHVGWYFVNGLGVDANPEEFGMVMSPEKIRDWLYQALVVVNEATR